MMAAVEGTEGHAWGLRYCSSSIKQALYILGKKGQ